MEKELVQRHGCTWKVAHEELARLQKELGIQGATPEERQVLLDAAHEELGNDGAAVPPNRHHHEVIPSRLFPPSWQAGVASDSVDECHKRLRIRRAQLPEKKQTAYPEPYRTPQELMFVVDHMRDHLPDGGRLHGAHSRICTEAELERIRTVAHGLRGHHTFQIQANCFGEGPTIAFRVKPIKDTGPIAKALVEEFPRLDITIQPCYLLFDGRTVYIITLRPPPGESATGDTDDSDSEYNSSHHSVT